MAKDIQAKCRVCRRAGEKLFLKGDRCFTVKCAIVKRNYPPGMHGVKRQSRLTEYGTQLRAKQKVKFMYGLREEQFVNIYKKAQQKKGNTGEIMMLLLEFRLDNVLYRSGLAKSRPQARQMVGHGHLLVNGRGVTIPSYQVKVGDVLQVKPGKLSKTFWENVKSVQKETEQQSAADWLDVNREKMEIKVMKEPDVTQLAENMASHMIVEFYSH